MKKFKGMLIIPLVITTILGGTFLGKTNYTVNAESHKDLINSPKSIWVWNARQDLKAETISNLSKLDISTVYLNTGYELVDYYSDGSPIYKQSLNSEDKDWIVKYSAFIGSAKKNGIKNVEALFGAPTWSLSTVMNEKNKDGSRPAWNPLTQINEVFKYNNSNKNNRFTAIHLDVEPHQVKLSDINKSIYSGSNDGLAWQKLWTIEDKIKYIKEFITNLKVIRQEIDKHNSSDKDNLRLVIDIAPSIPEYKLFMKDFFEVADEIVLMNYTKNQLNYLANAIDYLSAGEDSHKKVTIGSEFKHSDDLAQITLFNKTQDQLYSYFKKPLEIFKVFDSFNGVALHDYENFNEYMKKYPKDVEYESEYLANNGL